MSSRLQRNASLAQETKAGAQLARQTVGLRIAAWLPGEMCKEAAVGSEADAWHEEVAADAEHKECMHA